MGKAGNFRPNSRVLESTSALAIFASGQTRLDSSSGGWGRLLNRVAHPLEFGFSKGAVFDFVFFLGCTAPSKKGQKFFNRHSRCPDQRSECSARELFVLWDREIRSHSGFCHHYVTSDLPHDLPARFAEGFHRFLAGNVAEPPHPLSRPLPLNSDDHRCAIGAERLHRLLIFSPQPCGDRFLDVLQSFLFVPSLGHTPGKCRALRHDPAVFCFFKRNMKDHWTSSETWRVTSILEV